MTRTPAVSSICRSSSRMPRSVMTVWSRSSLILCGLDRIAAVVTDSGIRDEDRQMLETAGVRLIVAETSALGDRQATVA